MCQNEVLQQFFGICQNIEERLEASRDLPKKKSSRRLVSKICFKIYRSHVVFPNWCWEHPPLILLHLDLCSLQSVCVGKADKRVLTLVR